MKKIDNLQCFIPWLTELCPAQGIGEIFYKDNMSEYIFEKISPYDDADGYDYGSDSGKKQ